MSEIWKTATLSEFVKEFIVPQRDKPTTFGGDIPWCRIEDFEGPYLSASKSGKCVTTKSVTEMPLRVFPTNTVLVSCSANLGICAITTRPLVTNQTFIGLVPKDDVDSKFLYYLMGSKSALLNEMATGVTIRYLSREKFSNLLVSIPSLPEQQRIVRLLDEAFEGIAIAKANTEKNLQYSRALFESHLRSLFAQGGERANYPAVMKAFTIKSLGELCRVVGGGTPSKGNLDYYNGTIPWATVRDMHHDLLEDTEHCISREAVESSSTKIIPGGNVVIATRVGLGKVCMLGQDTAINQDLRGIIPLDENVLNVRYLFWVLKSMAHTIVSEGTGATVQGVKLPFVKGLQIPLPPLAEQVRIAASLDRLKESTNHLAESYEAKRESLNALKMSLLSQAFSGDLKTA